jgi:hypothetical protein
MKIKNRIGDKMKMKDSLSKETELQKVTCYECDRKRSEDRTDIYELFDTPFDELGITSYLCNDEFGHAEVERKAGNEVAKSWEYYESCSEVLKDTSWADFRYFTCERCYRTICEQNKSNGWHIHYRIVNECEQICLKCYEDEILENGISRESVENRELSGMFFNSGDLKEWDKFIDYRFINDDESENRTLDEVLTNMDNGYKVIIDYEKIGAYRKKQ